MMKPVLLFASVVFAVLLAGGVALAATINCPNREGNLCVGTNSGDIMSGTDKADEMRGRGGPDSIAGDPGSDELYGGDGQDLLKGNKGKDTLGGGLGYDDLRGGTGDDTFDAGPGDASYHFLDSWGRDIIEGTGPDGGRGYLHLQNNLSTSAGVTVHLEPSSERAEVRSRSGENNTINFTLAANIRRVHGTDQADVIRGSQRRDHLEGYPGSDTLYAQDGEADRISCGDGNDTVYYDEGLDSFTFNDCETRIKTPP